MVCESAALSGEPDLSLNADSNVGPLRNVEILDMLGTGLRTARYEIYNYPCGPFKHTIRLVSDSFNTNILRLAPTINAIRYK